jgi:LysM repeat protein
MPQGSILEQKNKGRAKVKIAVFFVLAVHGIGLLALLMQGCHKEEPSTAQQTADQSTNSAAATQSFQPSQPVVVETSTPPAASNTTPAVAVPETPAAPAATEYVVKSGDSFSRIASNFHVTSKAIADANPGVDPVKLQIGQKLHIPAPTPAATPGSTTAAAPSTNAAGESSYTVKSGDTLIKIASQYGTTVKSIRASNNLKTDSIKVGQKLVIPTRTAALPPLEPSSGVATSAPVTPR